MQAKLPRPCSRPLPASMQANLSLLALMLLGACQFGQAQPREIEPVEPGCKGMLQPYRAHYDVYRNGKLFGTASSELSRDSNGRWLYTELTKATKGVVGLLGGRIEESVRFAVEAGVLRAEHYDMSQKLAFAKIKRTADFDWEKMLVHGKNKRKTWQLALQGEESDRLSATFKIRQLLAVGTTQFSLMTVEKGDFKVRDFEARETETVDTGLGEMIAIPVHRKHSNAARTTIIWFAPQLGYLPIRMMHAKQGDDSGELILREFQLQEC